MRADTKTQARQHMRGFTLIEVLIALAFLAIAMGAVIATVGASIRDAAELQNKTYAHWVAMNEVTTLRLALAWPEIGNQKGNTKLAGQKWDWQAKVSTTPDPDLRRVDVTVSSALSPDTVEASITGFIGRPFLTAPNSAPLQTTNPGGAPR